MDYRKIDIFESIIKDRRAVRGFLPAPVPEEILKIIFTLAQRAPSNCNTQPWVVSVVSGKKCEELRFLIPEALARGEISLDFPYDGKYEGVYKDRQYDAAKQLYDAMGIAKEDKEKRNEALQRNFSFFGAPHVAFVFMPENFHIREAVDIGMYAQTLMLSMAAYGVASCPQTALCFTADLIRKQLDIDARNKLLFGISFGYEDMENTANKCRVGRASLTDAIQFKV